MIAKSERLTVLSDAEQEALYGLPDFDNAQRLEYLALTEAELAIASSRPGLHAKVYCVLQIGYFKAKHAFFGFDWNDVQADCAFVLSRYFHAEAFEHKLITKHEHYSQRERIAELFGYQPWAADFLPQLAQQAAQIVRRDVTAGFVAAELIVWLNEHKIIRPGYTTLQELVSEALSVERRRLGGLLVEVLDESAKAALSQLLVRDDTLSQLAALKQDAKDFSWRQMAREREKRATLEPLHGIAKTLLPKMGVSQQNLLYYASLANFYTVHDLRNLKADQTQLYLLCYAWVRYRQLTDNLVDAMAYHMKQLEEGCSAGAKQSFTAEQVRRHQETPQVGRLLSLYVDDSVADPTPFGEVRQRAYKIMSRDVLQSTAQRMSVKQPNKLALHWQAVDGLAERIRRHLRPLYVALDFVGTAQDSPWLAALTWAKSVFAKQQRLSERPLAECPEATLPKRLRPYLLTFDGDGNPTGLHADRYEFWLYRQVRKRFQSGELYLDDSLQHRHFSDELVIGAHEYEGHHVFDVWYRNTSDIVPSAITGDMHSVNKANFAILHWFGLRFEPRFTDLDDQLQELYCADDPALYEKCLIRPAGRIDRQLIVSEKANIDQIVATLGLKEMTQATLIRKLCTYTAPNPTRRAIFEFDKLVRSIYTLRYLRDPQLERNVHRSQNRIESYHQLRSTIAQVGGKKELSGRTDIQIEISNQCARLIANAIIYYNSAILSRLLTKYEVAGNAKALELITQMSPAAWRHILLNGHYTFQSDGKMIDLDALVAELELG